MAHVPIFISSTFVDFNRERDILCGPVSDRLNARARTLGASVEIVDLRWGVDTADDEESVAQRRVLDVCLGEVARCGNVFVGLIGDRYGWMPGAVSLRSVLDSASLGRELDLTDSDLESMSLSALEFEYAMAAPVRPETVIFHRSMPGASDPRFVDSDPTAVTRFRSRVESLVAPDAIVDFRATLNERGEPSSDFETLALERLWPIVEGVVRSVGADVSADPYTAAARHRSDGIREYFRFRDDDIDRIVAAAGGGRGVVVTGPPGVGLSSVSVHALDRFAERGEVWECAVGLTPDSASTNGIASRMLALAGSDPGPSPASELSQVLTTRDDPLTIVLDDADRIVPTYSRDPLELPLRLAAMSAVTLVCTAHDPDVVQRLADAGLATVMIEPFDSGESRRIMEDFVSPRKLHDSAIEPVTDAMRTPLWLRLAARDLTSINTEELLVAQTADNPATALRTIVAGRASTLPDDLPEMLARVLERIETRVIESDPSVETIFAVRDLVAALALAHVGLREIDLVELAGTGHRIAVTLVVQFLDVLLAPSGPEGALRFQSPMVRESALAWTGVDPTCIHRRIAAVLTRRDRSDGIRQGSFAWHAACAGSSGLLAEALRFPDSTDDDGACIDVDGQRAIAFDQVVAAFESDPDSGEVVCEALEFAPDVWVDQVQAMWALYWGRLEVSANMRMLEILTRKLVESGVPSLAGDPMSAAKARVMRGDYLSRIGRIERASSEIAAADELLLGPVGESGGMPVDVRVMLARMHMVQLRHHIANDNVLRIVTSQGAQNLVNGITKEPSTHPVTVLRPITDAHLLGALALETASKMALAEDCLGAANDVWRQCAVQLPEDDEWVLTRILKISVAKARLSIARFGLSNEVIEALGAFRDLGMVHILPAFPSSIDAMDLMVEIEYLLAQAAAARGSRADRDRHLAACLDMVPAVPESSRLLDRRRRLLVRAYVMRSENQRVEGGSGWMSDLRSAVDICQGVTVESLDANLARGILSEHFHGLILLCLTGTDKRPGALRRLFGAERRLAPDHKQMDEGSVYRRIIEMSRGLVPLQDRSNPVLVSLKYLRSTSVRVNTTAHLRN